jgi:uncharacterized protein YeaO (DUF488 family)
VPKAEYGRKDFYDVWLPELAPSDKLVKVGLAARDGRGWPGFVKRYRAEMKSPAASRVLDLLAALSHHADFSVGCYCENEDVCHRSILRELLREHGARID